MNARDKADLLAQLEYMSGMYATTGTSRTKLAIQAHEAGASWHEIGAALGMTEAGARQLVNRAKKGGRNG